MASTLEQILQQEKPEVVVQAKKTAANMLLNIHLAELRDRMGLTQHQLAQALNIKQPTVSDMEQAGRDIKLSSLKRYVEAFGGKLHIAVELPDGSQYDFSV